MPAPVLVGNGENINTGVPELDKELMGIWWMKDNPIPEELASMAGAFTEYTGQNIKSEDFDWTKKLVVQVPNSLRNHWAWPDTFASRNFIMPQYTSATTLANNFTFESPIYGEISTA